MRQSLLLRNIQTPSFLTSHQEEPLHLYGCFNGVSVAPRKAWMHHHFFLGPHAHRKHLGSIGPGHQAVPELQGQGLGDTA